MQVLDRLQRLDQRILAHALWRKARKLAPPSDPVARATGDTLSSGQQDSMRVAAVRGDTAADADTAWTLAALIGQQLERSTRRRPFIVAITAAAATVGAVLAVVAGQVTLVGVVIVGVLVPQMQLVTEERNLALARAANLALVVKERSPQAAID